MDEENPHVEISAPEDLMREHGVLNRILFVYEAGVKRLAAGRTVRHLQKDGTNRSTNCGRLP